MQRKTQRPLFTSQKNAGARNGPESPLLLRAGEHPSRTGVWDAQGQGEGQSAAGKDRQRRVRQKEPKDMHRQSNGKQSGKKKKRKEKRKYKKTNRDDRPPSRRRSGALGV